MKFNSIFYFNTDNGSPQAEYFTANEKSLLRNFNLDKQLLVTLIYIADKNN